MIDYYHRDINTLHLGCEKPRAYFIPFAEGDNTEKRENSSYFALLNGEWDFRFYDNVYEIDLNDSTFPSAVTFDDSMTVPYCWQAKDTKKYDAPNYINQDYPFPVDPPELNDVIPCALYHRTLEMTKKSDKKYYLNFEGVSSCFYLFINGVFCAYSEVSHATTEIDVTDLLADGDNDIHALVVKHCTGSYMEDQDFFRLSGIFRDVYLLQRDSIHLRDIFIKHYVTEALDGATVDISTDFTGEISADYSFADENGNVVNAGKLTAETEFTVEKPILWNPEKPYLYTLEIRCGSEIICFEIGLRRLEIKDSVVLLNGVGVKARGINRHDSNPETGYAVTVDEMMTDLKLMRAASVNMIRTSHYPNDPRFPEMCDRLGFMLCDEADLESHGMGYNYGDWYWDFWAHVCDVPEWKEACLDRARRLFERDKNHSCVVLWSLGNESGCGENHRAMADYIRARDDRAIIHYENARLEYEERVGGRDFKDISDVESRMYASISYLNEYLRDDTLKKPFFYCEYVCSMSTGDAYRHWDGVENHPKYFGGCIWEWCDHAVNIGTKENPVYRYGGDFGDEPNDNYCCVDGLVFPDRTPRPGYYDIKKVYKPFNATLDGNTLSVFNRRFYTDLSDFYIVCQVEKDGVVVSENVFTDISVAPQTEEKFEITVPSYDSGKDTVTVNVYLRLKDDAWYEKAGYEIGFEQIILSETNRRPVFDGAAPVTMKEERTEYLVECDGVSYSVSKITGLITKIEKNGSNYLLSPLDFDIYRSTNYNNRGDDGVWKRARFDRCRHHVYRTFIQGVTPTLVSIRADIAFAAAAMPPALIAQVSYVFTEKGVNVVLKCDVTERAPRLPRFGLRLDMAPTFENMRYFGYGPLETYSDRFRAGRLSVFNTTVDDNFVPYIKPQECGAHYSCRYAEITDEKGRGLEFYADASEEFCFNAKHYSDTQLRDTLHLDELEKEPFTRINLDYKIDASSGNDEGTEPFRHFTEKQFWFDYRIRVK